MTQVLNNISIIGAGAWGTALADVLAKAGRKVTLYARDTKLAEKINSTHENAVYLPGEKLSKDIRATADAVGAVAGAELVMLVTPAQYLRETLKRFSSHLPKDVPLVNCAKGIEMTTGYLLSEVAHDIVP